MSLFACSTDLQVFQAASVRIAEKGMPAWKIQESQTLMIDRAPNSAMVYSAVYTISGTTSSVALYHNHGTSVLHLTWWKSGSSPPLSVQWEYQKALRSILFL